MKTKLLIAIISFFITHQLIAQEYIPMAIEGAHWIVGVDVNETIEPVDGLWEYYALGDSLINNINYKKIYFRELVVTQDGPPFLAESPYELYGFLRDDISDRKVYAILTNEYGSAFCPLNEEYLLFDFSIQLGDTVDICIVPDFYEFIVNEITSYEVLGFNTRVYSSNGFGELFEGMGSNYGLFEDMFEPFKKSDSKSNYNTYLYFYCRESPCLVLVGSPEYYSEIKLKVYPNPANNYVVFETENTNGVVGNTGTKQSHTITITNTYGQQITILQVKDNKTVWDIRSINSGVYFYSLMIAGEFKSGKIIIGK